MSSQSYIDDQLVGSGHIAKGALVGFDGSTWATSPGFTVSAAEGAALVAMFNNPANVFASGITAAGCRYLALKSDARSIYGKKGTSGVVCVKTGQCVIVGVYGEKQQPGSAANSVEKLADYLIENGY